MKVLLKSTASFFTLILCCGGLFLAGCTDTMLSGHSETAVTTDTYKNTKLRHGNLLTKAEGRRIVAAGGKGKGKSNDGGNDGDQTVEELVHLVLGFQTYEADGVTRRVLDEYGITQRILDEYGVTRRVLEEYGVTQRVLEEYGITQRVLEKYGLTMRILEEYGVTQRILDDYGVTARMLEDYMLAYTSKLNFKQMFKSAGGFTFSMNKKHFDTFLAEITPDQDVAYVEPDIVMQSTPLTRTSTRGAKNEQQVPWGIDRMGAPLVKAGETNVHAYILDSGITRHDLMVKEAKDFTMLFTNRDQLSMDESQIKTVGYFDPGEQGNPMDHTGHGTHIAGTTAALDNKTGVLGGAPGVKLHSLKVLTDQGQTDITTVVAAIDYVIAAKKQGFWDEGLKRYVKLPVVMNLSLGMDIGTLAYNILDEAVQRAIDNGITVVVSAGNDGMNAATYSPAHVKDAITVGAYNPMDEFASWSNYGPTVDLLAPGVDIVSVSHESNDYDRNVLILMNGTSMAAPHVTAAAALYLSNHPHATPGEVAQALKDNAEATIGRVPAGTTNLAVSLKFMQDPSKVKPLSLDKAEWKRIRGKMGLDTKGTANPEADVTLKNTNTGEIIEVLKADDRGFWSYYKSPKNAPCSVTVASNGEAQTRTVDYADANCQ